MRYFLLRPETLFLLCISLALWSYFFHTDEVKTIVKSSRDAVKMVKGKVAEIMQNDQLGGLDVLDAEFSKTWEFKNHNVAVYSIQGRRDHMEDRFEVITDLVNKTHPSIFGIFDGHGDWVVSGPFSVCGLNEKQFDWSVVGIAVHILHGSPKSQNREIGILIAIMGTGVM
ncbi:Protein phosphatase 1L, partial [Ophiophagus hannah]